MIKLPDMEKYKNQIEFMANLPVLDNLLKAVEELAELQAELMKFINKCRYYKDNLDVYDFDSLAQELADVHIQIALLFEIYPGLERRMEAIIPNKLLKAFGNIQRSRIIREDLTKYTDPLEDMIAEGFQQTAEETLNEHKTKLALWEEQSKFKALTGDMNKEVEDFTIDTRVDKKTIEWLADNIQVVEVDENGSETIKRNYTNQFNPVNQFKIEEETDGMNPLAPVPLDDETLKEWQEEARAMKAHVDSGGDVGVPQKNNEDSSVWNDSHTERLNKILGR